MSAKKYRRGLAKLLPEWSWNIDIRRPLTAFNPTKINEIREQKEVVPVFSVFDYDVDSYEEKKNVTLEECTSYINSKRVTWINVDGIRKADVETICKLYGVHHLLVEDIISTGQRAKMDDTENVIFTLLPMMYYNADTGQVEAEQVSIVLGPDFVISFQEDPSRDVFNPIRDRIRTGGHRLRRGTSDYLCYCLIDIIVDGYFGIIERISERIERLEDRLLLQQKDQAILSKLSILRREVMVMKRSTSPVRELVHSFIKSDSDLLEEEHEKYYKDVLDHITQANEYVENHRDMIMNLQDLSMSQINLRMNEVMKVFTLLATLMAPATLIGGIFGMNFDVIPLSNQRDGFYITVGLMLIIPLLMLFYFRRKGWF